MRKKFFRMNPRLISILGVILATVLVQTAVPAVDKGNFSTTPTTHNGKKWRIGCYEGGEYIEYQQVFTATVKSLMDLGWIEKVDIPPQEGEQTRRLWQWLSEHAQSDYIEFVRDAHYSAQWNEDVRNRTVRTLIQRLNQKKDIDLMVALGTWAGKDMAADKISTPTVVLSTSDALAAGIIKSIDDSGYDHIQARMDPYRYERQIRVFHDVIGFERLGIIYENSVDGISQAALGDVEKMAAEKNFEIERCFSKSDNVSKETAYQSVYACFEKLKDKVDALYVTRQHGIDAVSVPELARRAISAKIPTFSQAGSDEVKAGLLMSISQAGWKYVGKFHAESIAKILNGAEPRQLNQLFEDPPIIAINLKTAELIGFDPPVDVLSAADEIYQEIAVP